jgi:hypothetical protein
MAMKLQKEDKKLLEGSCWKAMECKACDNCKWSLHDESKWKGAQNSKWSY